MDSIEIPIRQPNEHVARYLRPRLFVSPIELHSLFDEMPPGSGDLILLFTKSGGADSRRKVNPRQSFVWREATRAIEPFADIAGIYRVLGIVMPRHHPRDEHNLQHLVRGAQCAWMHCPLKGLPKSTIVFVRRDTGDAAALEDALLAILPYLEIYRGQSLHSFNDTFQTRHSELLRFVPKMSASPQITARRLLEHAKSHPRFGIHRYVLLERTADGSWHTIQSTDEDTQEVAEAALRSSETEILATGKVLGVSSHGGTSIYIPFNRTHPRIEFDRVCAEVEFSACAFQPPPVTLHPGDLVLALFYEGQPRQAVVHSLLYFRQYYYDTYYPALLSHLAEELSKRTREIHYRLNKAPRDERPADPWGPFKETCEAIFPTLGTALSVSVALRTYEIGKNSLQLLYQWPKEASERPAVVSMRRGERDIEAITFVEERPTLYEERKDVSGAMLSRFCSKLRFRQVPIGTVCFQSTRRSGIIEQDRKLLLSFVNGLQDYLREFLAVQDADWLSLTAAAYHNLHELRQVASVADTTPSRVVLDAISSFDRATEAEPGTLLELQEFFNAELDALVNAVPAFSRASFRETIGRRCLFNVLIARQIGSQPISRTRIELVKRIFKNLIQDFDLYRPADDREVFSIGVVRRPYTAVRFRQVQNRPFDESWFGSLGFRPLQGDEAEHRLHHGLFLCSAIARFLGGFAWIGNQDIEALGKRSVVEIVLPLREGAE